MRVHSVEAPSPPSPSSSPNDSSSKELGLCNVAAFGASLHSSQPVMGLSWNHSGQVLMSCSSDGTCALLKPQSSSGTSAQNAKNQNQGSCLGKLPIPKGQIGGVNAISLSLGSRYLACAGDDGVVRVWDLKLKKTVRTIKDHSSFAELHADPQSAKKSLRSVCFSLDDSCIASGGESGIVMVHNLRSNKRVALLRAPAGGAHVPGVRAVHFSPRAPNELAVCYDNGNVVVWDTKAQRVQITFSNAHRAAATSVCFSPSRPSQLVSVGLDKRIVFFDVANGGKKVKMMLAREPLTSVSFSPCGRYIAAGSVGGSVHLYSISSHSPLRILNDVHAPGPVNDVKFYLGSAREASGASGAPPQKKKGGEEARRQQKEQSPLLANKIATERKSKQLAASAAPARTATAASPARAPKMTNAPKVDPPKVRDAPKAPATPIKPPVVDTPAMPSPAPDLIGAASDAAAPRAASTGGVVASREALREMFEDMKTELKEDVQNMHLELLRQFQVQLSDISVLLDTYTTKFGDVVRENGRLREENERLRNRY